MSLRADRERYFGINRYICSVLEDMRSCWKTRNFAPIAGLISEAQVLANRMEAALADQKDFLELSEECSKLRKEYKKLIKEVEALESKKKSLLKTKKKKTSKS